MNVPSDFIDYIGTTPCDIPPPHRDDCCRVHECWYGRTGSAYRAGAAGSAARLAAAENGLMNAERALADAEKEVTNLRAKCGDASDVIEEIIEEMERKALDAEAREKGLREALQEIIKRGCDCGHVVYECPSRKMARAALARAEGEK